MIELKQKQIFMLNVRIETNTGQCVAIKIVCWAYFHDVGRLILKVTVNNFSIMLGRSHRFLGITSTFGE